MRDEELSLDRLASGDRPSLYMLGLTGAQALQEHGVAVFMTDALGRVCLMPAKAVQVVSKPKVSEEELGAMSKEAVIEVMVAQGSTDAEILAALAERKS